MAYQQPCLKLGERRGLRQLQNGFPFRFFCFGFWKSSRIASSHFITNGTSFTMAPWIWGMLMALVLVGMRNKHHSLVFSHPWSRYFGFAFRSWGVIPKVLRLQEFPRPNSNKGAWGWKFLYFDSSIFDQKICKDVFFWCSNHWGMERSQPSQFVGWGATGAGFWRVRRSSCRLKCADDDYWYLCDWRFCDSKCLFADFCRSPSNLYSNL